jgi:hypothetical protein
VLAATPTRRPPGRAIGPRHCVMYLLSLLACRIGPWPRRSTSAASRQQPVNPGPPCR